MFASSLRNVDLKIEQGSKSRHRILLMGGLGNQLFIISEAIRISTGHQISVNGYWYLDNRSNEGERAYFAFDLDYSFGSYLLHRALLKIGIRSFARHTQGYFQKPVDHQIVPEMWSVVENSVDSKAPQIRGAYAAIHLRLRIDIPDWTQLSAWVASTGCKEIIVLADSKEIFEKHRVEFEKNLPVGRKICLQRLDPLQDFLTLIGAHSTFFSDSTFSWWAFIFRRHLFGSGLNDLTPDTPIRCPKFEYV